MVKRRAKKVKRSKKIKRRPVKDRKDIPRGPVTRHDSSLENREIEPPMQRRKPTFKEKFRRKVREIKKDLKNKFIAIFFLAFSGFCFWILMQLLYGFYGFSLVDWIKDLPYLYETFKYFFDEISSGSDIGIFYLFLFSSLFFLPIPMEALFFKTMHDGLTFAQMWPLVVGGIICGQIINYLLGRLLGFIFISFIKRKTRKDIKRKLSKYGIVAVTGVHVVPFPFQIFNFITGILRYPILKWVLFMALGTAVKHLIMYYLYIAVF